MFKRIRDLFSKPAEPAPAAEEEVVNPCCDQPEVHIAYRGKSDDRMYIAYNRSWSEVKFFQPNGLRVFCKVCRRRVY
jgi:hypothetical protein